MAITLNQVALLAKDLVREPVSDTIATSLMEDYVRNAYNDWCQELQWPEGDLVQNSVASTQEYSLPDTLNVIFRVYINGQRCVPTTIPLIEGDVAGRYDPSWRVLPAAAIPELTSGSSLGVPITSGASSSRVLYYIRGGKIGFVPKPSAVYEIKIEAAVFPASPASGDTLVFPDQFKDGLAYGAVKRFLYSDRRVEEARGFEIMEVGGPEEKGAGGEMGKAMRWRRRLAAAGSDNLPFVQPFNYRGFYSRANATGR